MGALVPVLTSTLVSQGVGVIAGELSRQRAKNSQGVALQQLQQQQNLKAQQNAQNAALERQKIALDSSERERVRKSALRRAVSRQRANFGAQGLGNGGGSSQAVLLGLFDESIDEKRRRENLDSLRLNAIDQNLAQGQSLNILQRTQLAEKQKVNDASTIERLKEINNLF